MCSERFRGMVWEGFYRDLVEKMWCRMDEGGIRIVREPADRLSLYVVYRGGVGRTCSERFRGMVWEGFYQDTVEKMRCRMDEGGIRIVRGSVYGDG